MRRFFTRKSPVRQATEGQVVDFPRKPDSVPTKRTCLRPRLWFVVLATALLSLATWSTAPAQTIVNVTNFDGHVVFELRFFEPADGGFGGGTSTRVFDDGEIEAITAAAQYWTDVLMPRNEMPARPDGSSQPVVVNIGTLSINNAWGDPLAPISNPANSNDPFLLHLSTALLADGTYVAPTSSGHGMMAFGTGFGITSVPLSQVGRVSGDITTVAIHEFGHMLGVTSTMELDRIEYITDALGNIVGGTPIWRFPQQLTRWQAHLRDNNGNSSVPGAYPDPNVPGKPVYHSPEVGYFFEMGDPTSRTQPAKFTFAGENVLEVFYDGNEQLIRERGAAGVGVPLQGLLPDGMGGWMYNNPNTMSHIDARNSTMSWQMYRNYPMFLEVELAAMQDMGYKINRGDFFGRSFYVDGNGETVVNTNGFNSTSTFGVGLHLFASNLNVVQGASLWLDNLRYPDGTRILAGDPKDTIVRIGDVLDADGNVVSRGTIARSGSGGVGIRIDGVNNTVTIPKGVSVTANGENGVGILASYGKDHNIIHQGILRATGTGGTAARFDFGLPNIGAQLGSYAFDPYYGYMEEGQVNGGFPEDLQGPLVKAFDVSGAIIGGSMSISVPVVTPGGHDRIITRGNDARFTDDSFTIDIVRVFEDGVLVVPNDTPAPPAFHFGLPVIDASNNLITAIGGTPLPAGLQRGSAVIINPTDGTATIIYEDIILQDSDHNREPAPENLGRPYEHIWCLDPAAYTVTRQDSTVARPDSRIQTRVSLVTLTNNADNSLFRVRISREVNVDADGVEISEVAGSRRIEILPDIDSTYVIYSTRTLGGTPAAPLPDIALITYENQNSVNIGGVPFSAGGDATAMVPNPPPGLLRDYRVDYLEDLADPFSYDGSRLLSGLRVRTLEDNPDAPWETYLAPDQDIVTFAATGGAAIFIAGPQIDDETGLIQGGAHVETINVMRGASIEGDIVSHYNSPEHRRLASQGIAQDLRDRGTTLTFGLRPNTDGKATSSADSDFNFVYTGNINYYQEAQRAYINDRPGFNDWLAFDGSDIVRWGDYNYNPTTGTYDYVGQDGLGRHLGRYLVTDSWDKSGRIDLRFAGGFTQFQAVQPLAESGIFQQNWSFVNSVVIDPTATFSLGDSLNSQGAIAGSPAGATVGDGVFATSLYLVEGFLNNGRFSGEGTVWVGARRENEIRILPEGTLVGVPIGYSAHGTFVNRGIIAPGPNNGHGEIDRYVGVERIPGRRAGTLAIAGNLDMGSWNSVYEVTIADGRTTIASTPAWETHPNWVTNPVYLGGQLLTEYLTLEGTPDPSPSWGIDPVTGLPILGERETIGGGWGYGESDRLVVSGTTILGGTLRVHVTPGNYSPDPTVYTIIRSEGGYAAGTNFDNIETYIGFLEFVPYDLNISNTYISPYDTRDLQFAVIRDAEYFVKQGRTFNERSVATAIDNSLFDSYQVAFSLADNRNSLADVQNMYHQIAGAVRANSLMMNLWSPSEVLFPRIGWGNGQMETGKRGRVDWNRIAGKKAKMLGQTPVRSRAGSLWGEMMNTAFNAESDGNSDGYNFHRTGFMFGTEMSLTPYSAIGMIAAYHNGTLKQVGDKAKSDDYLLGTYFVAAPFNMLEFKAYMGLGMQAYDIDRRIYNANIITDRVPLEDGVTGAIRGVNDRYAGKTQGNSFNVSLELARPFELHPTFILRPTLGIDAQHIWQYGYLENDFRDVSSSYGSNIYALRYSRVHHQRGLLRAGFSSETSGPRGGIRMRAFYVSQFDGGQYPISNATFATGGERFTVRGVNMGSDYLHFGVGANFWLDGEKTSALVFDYDANIYGVSHKINAHMANVGFLQRF